MNGIIKDIFRLYLQLHEKKEMSFLINQNVIRISLFNKDDIKFNWEAWLNESDAEKQLDKLKKILENNLKCQ